MTENIVKVVNIIEKGNTNEEPEISAAPTQNNLTSATIGSSAAAPIGRRYSSMNAQSHSARGNDEYFFAAPTISERCLRYLMVVIYLCGLCSIGFFLSIYHIFFWDSQKIVIPEKIAIRLLNSSEVTAEQFYKHILEQYRILYQLQRQRQQYLQQQHLHLQQLAAANKFQEIFATATIIQANPNEPIKKLVMPTNGTYLLQPHSISDPSDISAQIPILGTEIAQVRRKSHRKHYQHHRHNGNKHRKIVSRAKETNSEKSLDNKTPLNQLATILKTPLGEPAEPIPLILNSKEDKISHHSSSEELKYNSQTRRRTTTSSFNAYNSEIFLNQFRNGELIFEK